MPAFLRFPQHKAVLFTTKRCTTNLASDHRKRTFVPFQRPSKRFVRNALKLTGCGILARVAYAYASDQYKFYKMSSEINENLDTPYTCGTWSETERESHPFVSTALHRIASIARFCAFLTLILSILVMHRFEWGSRHLDRVVALIEHLGPVYVKFCQWASTRGDIFDRRIICALQRTTFRSMPHSYETTLEVLRGEGLLGTTIGHVDPKIIGSGCAAQVHRAKYIPTGEDIVVKVLHPYSKISFEHDLDFFLCIAWALDGVFKYSACYESAMEFRHFMLSQFNLVHEAHNLRRFAHNFREIDEVSFPKTFMDATTQKVLTQGFAEGTLLSEFMKDEDGLKQFTTGERQRLAALGARSFFKMLLIDNFTHGDLHPGNIIIQKVRPSNPMLETLQKAFPFGQCKPLPSISMVFLDCGLAFKLSKREKKNFAALFEAMARCEFDRAATLFKERAPLSNCPDVEQYMADMVKVLHGIDSSKRPFKDIQFGPVLHRVWNTLIHHHIGIESKFTSLFSSVAVVEGIGRGLDPDLNIVLLALPFLARTSPTEKLQRSGLVNVLTFS